MPFPEGLPTTLVQYTAANPAGGGPAVGTVEFAPAVPVIKVDGYDEVFTGRGTYQFDEQGRLVDGAQVGVRLLPNDIPGSNPSDWVWLVTVRITGAPVVSFYMKLGADQLEVNLADVQQLDPAKATYVAVVGPAGPQGEQGEPGPPGGGGGAVDSVNGHTGVVVLDAVDVSADPEGSAAEAEAAAAADATSKVQAHAASADPHNDRAYSDGALAAHTADSTNVHGIADTSLLETAAGAAAKVAAHTAAADPHGDRGYTDTQVATRAAATTQITAGTGLTGGGTLAADRTLAVAVGTTAGTVAAGDDARLSDSRTPTPHAATHAAAGADPVTLTQAQIAGLAAALEALLPLAGGTLTGPLVIDGDNLTVQREDGAGAYRFRVTGGGLDLEIGGLDVTVSAWSGADFTGTQNNVMRWESAGPHLIGRAQFGTSPFDNVHDIDSGTGVAAIGKKNGLANLRICGFKASAGAPTAGTWTTGDVVLDSAGAWHLCTAGGTPGTWT